MPKPSPSVTQAPYPAMEPWSQSAPSPSFQNLYLTLIDRHLNYILHSAHPNLPPAPPNAPLLRNPRTQTTSSTPGASPP
ncbi:hypothetical protein DXG01_011723, partial [Tephrocybe rancida]